MGVIQTPVWTQVAAGQGTALLLHGLTGKIEMHGDWPVRRARAVVSTDRMVGRRAFANINYPRLPGSSRPLGSSSVASAPARLVSSGRGDRQMPHPILTCTPPSCRGVSARPHRLGLGCPHLGGRWSTRREHKASLAFRGAGAAPDSAESGHDHPPASPESTPHSCSKRPGLCPVLPHLDGLTQTTNWAPAPRARWWRHEDSKWQKRPLISKAWVPLRLGRDATIRGPAAGQSGIGYAAAPGRGVGMKRVPLDLSDSPVPVCSYA